MTFGAPRTSSASLRVLVVGHADAVTLQGCKFVVNQAGRQRVIKEKRKNVHAFVEGQIVHLVGFTSYKGRMVQSAVPDGYSRFMVDVTYNPYKYESFVTKGNDYPIHSSGEVTVTSSGKIEAAIA